MPPSHVRILHEILPDVKILLQLRHPVDRDWAGARRVLTMRLGKKLEDIDEATFHAFIDEPAVRARSDYESMLDTWFGTFGREQVMVFPYESVAETPQDILQEVFRFIGVSDDVSMEDWGLTTKVNANPRLEMPASIRQKLELRYLPVIGSLAERFGAPFTRWTKER